MNPGSDLLSRMQPKYNIDDLTSDLSKLEAGKVDLVILFNSRKVSNDGCSQCAQNMQHVMAIMRLYMHDYNQE